MTGLILLASRPQAAFGVGKDRRHRVVDQNHPSSAEHQLPFLKQPRPPPLVPIHTGPWVASNLDLTSV